MGTEPMTAEVSAALARTRRRARYLEAAEPGWMHLLSAAISVAIGIYLIGSSDAEVSRGTVGLVMILSSFGAWQYHRLATRVEALTKLLAEVGYPGEA